MCWASETRYPPVADVISIAQYKVLRENHVSGNAKCNYPEKEDNKLYQIQPVLNHVRENCILLEPGIEHSIDEQIIPTETSCSGIRWYHLSGPFGIMYDFFFYSGSVNCQKCTGSYIVLRDTAK